MMWKFQTQLVAFYLQRTVLQRACLSLAIIFLFSISYFGAGSWVQSKDAYDLSSKADRAVPLIPITVWAYLSVFPAAMSPIFIVKCSRRFQLTAMAYAIAIGVSALFFVVLPCTAQPLRPMIHELNLDTVSGKVLATIYELDPPHNLFPSLHISIAAISAFSVLQVSRHLGQTLCVNFGFVVVSVCTVKQHVIVDVFGGIGVAMAIFLMLPWPKSMVVVDLRECRMRQWISSIVFLGLIYTLGAVGGLLVASLMQ